MGKQMVYFGMSVALPLDEALSSGLTTKARYQNDERLKTRTASPQRGAI
jgi:hypothetical protein